MARYKSAYNRTKFGAKAYSHIEGEEQVRAWGLLNTYWFNETTGVSALRVRWSAGEIDELWTSADGEKFNLVYGPCPCCNEEIRSHCVCSDDARSGRTRVIYRVDKDSKEVYAVMPEIDSTGMYHGKGVQVYAKSFIAGMSPRAVMETTRRASPTEIERSGLPEMMAHDGFDVRRITYAQLMSDDCNGGIGPHDYANDLYDVGCSWGEGYGVRGMRSDRLVEKQRQLKQRYGKKD